MLTESNANYVLDEVVTAVAFDAGFVSPSYMAELFFAREATGRRERTASVAGFTEFADKPETQEAGLDELVQQYEKTFVPVAKSKNVVYSRELARDEEWGMIAGLSRNFGDAFNVTVEKAAAALFNDSFAGTKYTGEDALSVCNTAHLNKDGGNSQSNYGTNALDMAGVKATRAAMRKTLDYRGVTNCNLDPKLLMCSLDYEEDAWKIAHSLGRPDTANRADNMFKDMFDILCWNLLGDPNTAATLTYWWMLDTKWTRGKQNLLWLWRDPFEMMSDGDFFSGTRKVGAYYRAIHGCVDWRGIYGNIPA
jgi:hypothetical protein